MVSDRWLKIGSVFGIIACVAFAVACGGGGSSGTPAATTVAMSMNISYPSASAKPSALKPDAVGLYGTVTIENLSGTDYTATYKDDTFVTDGVVDTYTFTANVPEGEVLFVVAKRDAATAAEALASTTHTERVELIIPTSEAGDETVDIDTTKAAAIVKKMAAYDGDIARDLSDLTQAEITQSVSEANTTLTVDLSAYDFTTMSVADIQAFVIDYAMKLAIAALAGENAGDWDDKTYYADYAHIASDEIAAECTGGDTYTDLVLDLGTNAVTAGDILPAVDAIVGSTIEAGFEVPATTFAIADYFPDPASRVGEVKVFAVVETVISPVSGVFTFDETWTIQTPIIITSGYTSPVIHWETNESPADVGYSYIGYDSGTGDLVRYGGIDHEGSVEWEWNINPPAVVSHTTGTIGESIVTSTSEVEYADGVLDNSGSLTSTSTALRFETITVPAGTYADCLVIKIVDVWSAGTDYENATLWLAKGVGIVRTDTYGVEPGEEWTEVYELTSITP